ncbi:Zinc transporter ztp29 [Asimina triloba]
MPEVQYPVQQIYSPQKQGALLVVLKPAPNLKMLGLLQGFAAGLMLCISFFDLAHNALNSVGFLRGNLWFWERDVIIGSIKLKVQMIKPWASLTACECPFYSNGPGFYAGVIFFAVVANFIPEPTVVPTTDARSKQKHDDGDKDLMKKHRRQVLFSGIVTAIGISLHNFPEGMAVFLGSMKGLRVGINLALAIALHNIPEAFKLATLSGLAEPLGVIIVGMVIACLKFVHADASSSIKPEILEGLLGSVGGVMAFLTLHEMLPLAFDYAGQKQAVKAVFFGMAFMSASLYFLEISLPQEMSL